MFESFIRLMYFLRLFSNVCEASGHLYAVGSVASHSCRPAAMRIAREAGLSALVTCVSLKSGEEITLSFMAALNDIFPRIRQIMLFVSFGFLCRSTCCRKEDVARADELTPSMTTTLASQD